MILIDETMLTNGTLYDIFENLGHEILYRKYTKEELDKVINDIREVEVEDEKDRMRMEAAINQAKNAEIIDFDRMRKEYIPLYQVKVGTYEGININCAGCAKYSKLLK